MSHGRHKVTSLFRCEERILWLIYDVIVMSYEMRLASRLHTTSARHLGSCVRGLAFLCLGVAKILRDK